MQPLQVGQIPEGASIDGRQLFVLIQRELLERQVKEGTCKMGTGQTRTRWGNVIVLSFILTRC